MIDALLWGFAAALFIFTLAGGVGGSWTVHRDKVHRRPHHRDGTEGNPLDVDDWER